MSLIPQEDRDYAHEEYMAKERELAALREKVATLERDNAAKDSRIAESQRQEPVGYIPLKDLAQGKSGIPYLKDSFSGRLYSLQTFGDDLPCFMQPSIPQDMVSRDAYDGAREEMVIWKRRALKAEADLEVGIAKLAAAQADNVRLRGVLDKARDGIVWYSENSDDADDSDTEMLCEIDAVLSQPLDTSALDALEATHTDTLQATITAMSAQHREEIEYYKSANSELLDCDKRHREEIAGLNAQIKMDTECIERIRGKAEKLDIEIRALRARRWMLEIGLHKLVVAMNSDYEEDWQKAVAEVIKIISASAADVEAWKNERRAEVLKEIGGMFIKWRVSERELRLVCASIEKRDALRKLLTNQPGSTT